jgi:prepilin-type N-terminal cleavage/methylation domain-containing protein
MARSRRAFTLVELTIVVMILTIIAAALSLGPPTAESQQKVDLTAEAVAMALRFARGEAIRVGEERGGAVVTATGRVFAAKPDLSGGGVGLDFILMNPLDKRDYDFTVGELPGGLGVELANATHAFQYQGLASPQFSVVFDPTGIPYYLEGGTRYPLTRGAVTLRHGNAERSVILSQAGRVTLQ